MRVSSSKFHRQSSTGIHSINIEASGEILEPFPEECSEEPEPKNPAKDNLDDAYTLLLPSTESEVKVKVDTNFPFERYFILNRGRL